ncbi:MAG: hypothetical protein ACQGVC_06550 [Myxococcota bacterium]
MRSRRTRSLAALLAALWWAAPAPAQEPDAPGLAAPLRVTDQPALSDAELARFVAVNRLAEPRRVAASEALFARHLEPEDAALGAALLSVLGGLEEEAGTINREACRQAGIACDEYADLGRRILQVNDLGWLELREQALADRSRRLDQARHADPRERALEAWQALHEVRTRTYAFAAEGVEQRLEARADAKRYQRVRRAERAQERLARMEGVRRQVDDLRALRAERERLLDDPRFAASRASIEHDVAQLDHVIARLERKLAPHQRAATRPPGADETVDENDPRLAQARQALEEQQARQPTEAELREIERGMRERQRREEREIAAERDAVTRLLASPAMAQARRDRPAVEARLADLVYLGRPLVTPTPSLPAAPDL